MQFTFQTVEEQITHNLIDVLLEAFPNNIIVEDEEGEITDKPTRDHNEIFEACRAVDMAYIRVNSGWVLLVNGNDADIISDYTVSLEPVLKDLNDAINKHFG